MWHEIGLNVLEMFFFMLLERECVKPPGLRCFCSSLPMSYLFYQRKLLLEKLFWSNIAILLSLCRLVYCSFIPLSRIYGVFVAEVVRQFSQKTDMELIHFLCCGFVCTFVYRTVYISCAACHVA